LEDKQTVSRTFSATKQKGLKAGIKECAKAFSYYGKSTASYYQQFMHKIPTDFLSSMGYTAFTSDFMKGVYSNVFGYLGR